MLYIESKQQSLWTSSHRRHTSFSYDNTLEAWIWHKVERYKQNHKCFFCFKSPSHDKIMDGLGKNHHFSDDAQGTTEYQERQAW